jgi:hypothetical protein
MSSTRYSCQILMKMRTILSTEFRKIDIKFNENSSCGSPVVSCGWADRQTEVQLEQ